MNYKEIKEYFSILPKFDPLNSSFDLENIRKAMSRFLNPQDRLKIVHFAGTNGKGSTLSYVESILKTSGINVGAYTSPYFEKYEESIRLNGKSISEKKFEELFNYVLKNCIDIQLSEFEFLTAIAFLYFSEKNCDIVLLETGLGGRLDSTNIVKNTLISVFTPISYDHSQILGDSIAKIAIEKSKIIKYGSMVITSNQEDEVYDIICKEAFNKGALVIKASLPSEIKLNGVFSQQFNIDNHNLSALTIKMLGEHQIYNACLAVEIIKNLSKFDFYISDESIRIGLIQTYWRGRYEVISNKPLIIIDGAHNIKGIKEFVKTTRKLFGNKKIKIIFGILKDKQYEKIIKELAGIAEKIYAITIPGIRGLDAKIIYEIARKEHIDTKAYNSIEEAIETSLLEYDKDDIIISVGSLYFIEMARKIFMDYSISN